MSNDGLVEVLLATYNGEQFLREQIESILAQDYAPLHVLARDDGSDDQTVAILEEYAQRYSDRFRVLPASPGTGSARDNFLRLMQSSRARYVCFSDQDDVWLRDKVSRTKQAMDELESQWGETTPLLVFTDLYVVDQGLKPICESFWMHERIRPDRISRLPTLLVQNVVTGSTAMLNRRLLEVSLRMPSKAFMHDHWIALLACCLGKSSAVRTQTVLYRQHGGNVFGVGERTSSPAGLKRWVSRRRTRERLWESSQRQAEALLAIHEAELSDEARRLLASYQPRGSRRSLLVRTAKLLRGGFFRVGVLSNLAMIFDVWTMRPQPSFAAARTGSQEPDAARAAEET